AVPDEACVWIGATFEEQARGFERRAFRRRIVEPRVARVEQRLPVERAAFRVDQSGFAIDRDADGFDVAGGRGRVDRGARNAGILPDQPLRFRDIRSVPCSVHEAREPNEHLIDRRRTGLRRRSDLLARKSGLPACGPQHQARKCLPLGVDETGGLGPFRGLGASRALESMLADSPRTVPMDPAYTRWAAASLIAMVRAAVVLVIVVAFVVVVGMLRAAAVVLVNIRRDVAPEIGA